MLRATNPIGRVVEPEDVAALAVHLMINTAVTGATYDIDGGQQFVIVTRGRTRVFDGRERTSGARRYASTFNVQEP